jgi:hypothetical protein
MQAMEFLTISKEITSLIREWELKLVSIPQDIILQHRNSQNRNIRQILGHMIDSASNNTHRVIHLQYNEIPLIFPNYATFGNNDRWIAIQNYQDEVWEQMIQLWKFSLLHFCHVIENVNPDKLDNEWISGPSQKIMLREMVADFPGHLKLHLDEIDALLNTMSTE